jgi:hypothetical protein
MLRFLLVLLCITQVISVPSKVIIITNVAKLKQYMKDIHIEKYNNTIMIHIGENNSEHKNPSFRDYILQKLVNILFS